MQLLQPNTTLQGGKYRIERVLGQGGFGNTYVGYNTEFEETVAIKEFFIKGLTERDESTCVVSVSNIDNLQQFEEQREKFKKEARRLRKLKNKHIVKVHDLFEENGTAYYVMDYIDGESLAEKIKRTGEAFPEVEVKGILLQILDALKEVHHNEIWHLDLKPGNIMLDKNGTAYLIDFGASKQIRSNGSMTTSTALCYTPGYAPNEQIGQMYERFGPWTDIYALGATVYNLLTNKKPPMAVDIDEDGEESFGFPENISSEMRELVIWMMQPKRKVRPQSVDEIVFKLETIKSTKPSTIVTSNDEETIISTRNISDSEETVLEYAKKQDTPVLHAVDLGLSVLWADCNLGETSTTPEGELYGWGDYTGVKKSCYESDYIPVHDSLLGKIEGDMGFSKFDIANIQWGDNWRMPNRKHWEELINKCKWYKTKNGYIVKGPNGNQIFLPLTGMRLGNKVINKDYGYYWTSEIAEEKQISAYFFVFNMEYIGKSIDSYNYIYGGRAVRPVCEK